MSKKILVLCMSVLLAVMALAAGCGSDKKAADGEKVLKVGTNADFAPFEFQGADANAYEGFDMDLIRAIGKEMGYKVEINNVAFDGLIPSLEAGNIDVIISGMTINDERKKKVLFSDSYYKSGLSIMVAKDNEAIKGFKDLKGKKIAVQIGTTSAAEAKKIEGAQVKELNSSADTFIELAAKGVDAVINDRPVNDRYIVESKNDNVKTLSELLTSEDYGIAINMKNTELQGQVNAALKKLKENGEYDKIYAKWFGEKK
ncbi:MAG: basic amino acid ABC transporter substrate-binding protein [Anaerovibrio sp.]|uniref:basic amino acid ABC transporter substrate-binding protein n=1 Tax=Anaerovibrio sp. TaxID=1872532 RepID=UPI0025E684A1|nr:basic amino acid ABC transporter substrate-binding protein [Anaerovibrio sp.]MCR5176272.1 basic amino acid ABC transporter substrate-binding protein [Anaerovibrio sp.]